MNLPASFRVRTAPTAVLGVVSLLVLAGCGSSAGGDGGESGTRVVASTTVVGDLARNVAGDRASVETILPANADPHDYEPQPSDAVALGSASLIVGSGGDLDLWLGELTESSGTDAPEIELIDSAETIEGGHDHGEHAEGEEHSHEDEHAHDEHGESEEHPEEGHSEEEHAAEGEHSEDGHSADEEHSEEEHAAEGIDPHWWQDPQNAVAAVEAIRDALIEADPDGRSEYEDNAAAYIDQIEELDTAVASCVDEVPEDERKLVTSHDALGYYADRYGIEVVGSTIPALTTQAQPSAGETAELVDLIRAEDVRAVFPELGVSAKLEQAVADESGAEIGGELYADTLGPEGSSGDSYLGMIRSNTEAMVAGFSGGTVDCELPEG